MTNRLSLKPIFTLVACFAIALALVGCSSGNSTQEENTSEGTSTENVTLEIYAANSLEKALDEVQELYTSQNPSVTFADTQYEASGTLVEKMKAGGEPDIFISASKSNMDSAIENGNVADGSQFDMFKNDLVIVTAESNDIDTITLEDAVSGDYSIAIGDANVPAGNYARQSLASVGCYTDENGTDGEITGAIVNQVQEADKVGSVCKLAESGEVDLAFVYSSDVERYGGVKVVCTVPADAHKDIIYPAAVTTMDDSSGAAQAFLDWCTTDPDAQEIWGKWGFELI
ncbi:MAG: molybdate ABC transporter substrate-binding protein [Eggerthellaceae bacterium]|nr:molybdate ABC transporter substrate-binding protein [Eggerthellaceae bacterium]MEE0343323.1 molybdate ABC transporter substrate-binding protein [Eggerthellaceae bacterium]